MYANDFFSFLNNISLQPLSVLDISISKSKYVPIDLSESNKVLSEIDVSSSLKFSNYINNYIKEHDALVAFGGYLEKRNIYKRSAYFNNQKEERNIHLGMDLWCEAKTPILAPLKGKIHSFKNNENYGDYGPTIVLQHDIFGVEFYTLYGHLSISSIENLKVGLEFHQGDKIGLLGVSPVNGDYPPHLHFQIIKDLEGAVGDYPGVCSKETVLFYSENSPNPNALLKLRI